MLSITNHDRNRLGLNYVYPVLSRRAEGLSIGINLNPNNACNWRCIYCQVPGLQRGGAPAIDLALLERELRELLQDVLQGDFFDRLHVPPAWREIRDIAISGNGEPTSSAEFCRVVDLIGSVAASLGLDDCKRVLISNGSLVHQPLVQQGLKRWGELGGILWFKLDSATDAGLARINNAGLASAKARANLETAAALCPVWIQTCLFLQDEQPPALHECRAYLELLADLTARSIPLQGVLLYGLARPSRQPEAPRLSALPLEWLESFANDIRRLGLEVKVSE
ncbi:MAG: radical SAM protein [Methylococcaceae bacterium]|nr:MAG: radical SAM protein [Methylococcaceae bacterium]